MRYARGRIAQIATVLKPSVVITVGVLAPQVLGTDRPAPEPVLSEGRIGYWTGCCLPLFHPNRGWPHGQRPGYLIAAQEQLRKALT
jgi:hypothetical protein